jgi:hypothetical protein
MFGGTSIFIRWFLKNSEDALLGNFCCMPFYNIDENGSVFVRFWWFIKNQSDFIFYFFKKYKTKNWAINKKISRFTVLFKNWILNKKPTKLKAWTFQVVDFTASTPSNFEKLIHHWRELNLLQVSRTLDRKGIFVLFWPFLKKIWEIAHVNFF